MIYQGLGGKCGHCSHDIQAFLYWPLLGWDGLMSARNRPLSPHLQIYRWELHMAMSIFHRASGAAMGVGLLLVTWGFVALATGAEAFEEFTACMASPLGRIALFGFTLALVYHALNGVRHLNWDTGRGLSKEASKLSGQIVIVLAIALTAALFYFGYQSAGLI